MTPNPSTGTLLQMVQQNDDKHEDAHKRLRADLRVIEERLATLEASHAALNNAQSTYARRVDDVVMTASDVSKLRFSPANLIWIVSICATIIGATYATNYGMRAEQSAIRSDVRNVMTQMEKQSELHLSDAKLQDERAAAFREELAAIKRESQLWKYDMQSQLKDILEKLQRQRR